LVKTIPETGTMRNARTPAIAPKMAKTFHWLTNPEAAAR